jgi:hypothetical protein
MPRDTEWELLLVVGARRWQSYRIRGQFACDMGVRCMQSCFVLVIFTETEVS